MVRDSLGCSDVSMKVIYLRFQIKNFYHFTKQQYKLPSGWSVIGFVNFICAAREDDNS